MRILLLAPYIFVDNHPYGSKNKSGLAYMIRAVADMLASEGNDVYVLTQSILTDEMKIGKWDLIMRNYWAIIKNIKFRYLKEYFRVFKADFTCNERIRALFYYLSGGHSEDVINKLKPDVIYIHSIGTYTLPYYYAASRFKIPVATTLHGLVSFNPITKVNHFTHNLERAFLRQFVEHNYSMSFISSGMLTKTQNFLGRNTPNIRVISNTFQLKEYPIEGNNRRNVKRLICVGSLTDLKNHIQVIRVFPVLQQYFAGQGGIELQILGDGYKMKDLKAYVQDHHIPNVQLFGRIPQEKVYECIKKSDLLVFPSIEEGFGIPIVEAYSCGVPVVYFSDIDAAKDVYDVKCSIMVEQRSDEALVKCIIKALETKWDSEEIKSFSKNFTQEIIGKQYNKFLQSVTVPIDEAIIHSIVTNAINAIK